MDIVDPATRSRMMSGIKSRNTKPEILVRKALFKHGFRFRLHEKNLPGKPDIVLPKYHAIIFIHGCFWHEHSCKYFKWPKSNTEFWVNKIKGNAVRDKRILLELQQQGWKTCVIWECIFKTDKQKIDKYFESLFKWVQNDCSSIELG